MRHSLSNMELMMLSNIERPTETTFVVMPGTGFFDDVLIPDLSKEFKMPTGSCKLPRRGYITSSKRLRMYSIFTQASIHDIT